MPAQDRRALGVHGAAGRLTCQFPLAFRGHPVNLCLRPRDARFGLEQGCCAPVEAFPSGRQPAARALDGLLRTLVPVRDEHGKVTDYLNKALLALVSLTLTLIDHPVALVDHPVALVSHPVALIGHPVALVSLMLALIGQPVVLIGQPVALVSLVRALIGQPVALLSFALAPVRSKGACLR